MSALTVTAIVVMINLIGMTAISSLLALFLARLHWRGHGAIPALATIVLAQFFWILPTFIGYKCMTDLNDPLTPIGASDSIFVGNCLVSAFSIILLCEIVRSIPAELADSARLDGCGWFGTYRRIVLPFVKIHLLLIGLLLVMATAYPFLKDIGILGWTNPPQPPASDAVFRVLAKSAIAAFPVIAIFIIAKRPLGCRRDEI